MISTQKILTNNGIPSMPSPFTRDFERVALIVLITRLQNCPTAKDRGTWYYVDPASGSSGNTGLTIGSPKDFAFIATALAASNGGLGFVILCGTTQRVTVPAIALNKPNCSVAFYVNGSVGRPLLSRWQISGSAGTYNSGSGLYTLVSGDNYSRAETGTVAWVRETANQLTVVYTRATSIAQVTATPYSFYQTGGLLYTNSGVGTPPNGKNLEVVMNNTDDGILITADGCRVEGLAVSGFHMHTTDFSTSQKYAIRTQLAGNDEACVVDCEGSFANYHVMGNYSTGSGGISTWVDCENHFVGYGGGATCYNTYATTGGQETIFWNCICNHGALPDLGNGYDAASNPRQGTAWYGHTGSGNQGLLLVWGFRARDVQYGYGNIGYALNMPTVTTLLDCRCYDINGIYEGGNGTFSAYFFENGIVRVSSKYNIKPAANAISQSLSGTLQQSGSYMSNCIVNIDMSNEASGAAFLYHSSAANNWEAYNCAFTWLNIGANVAGFNYDTWGGSTSADSGVKMKNCIVQRMGTFTTGSFLLCLANTYGVAGRLSNGAYYGLSNLSSATTGYSGDANGITMARPVDVEMKPSPASQLYRAGTTNMLRLEFDFSLLPRNPKAPSIGPCSDLVRIVPVGVLSRA